MARSARSVDGGAEGDRTLDLMTASHALSQLSYSPNATGALWHRGPNTVKKRAPDVRALDAFPRAPIVYLAAGAQHARRRSTTTNGSAWGPVALPVFKTACRAALPSGVGSTPTRFRHEADP